MNCYWTLTVDCKGYKAGSHWRLERISDAGWTMRGPEGFYVTWSNPDLFKAGW